MRVFAKMYGVNWNPSWNRPPINGLEWSCQNFQSVWTMTEPLFVLCFMLMRIMAGVSCKSNDFAYIDWGLNVWSLEPQQTRVLLFGRGWNIEPDGMPAVHQDKRNVRLDTLRTTSFKHSLQFIRTKSHTQNWDRLFKWKMCTTGSRSCQTELLS